MFFNSPKNNSFLLSVNFNSPKTMFFFPKYNPTVPQKPNPTPNICLSQKNFLGNFLKISISLHKNIWSALRLFWSTICRCNYGARIRNILTDWFLTANLGLSAYHLLWSRMCCRMNLVWMLICTNFPPKKRSFCHRQPIPLRWYCDDIGGGYVKKIPQRRYFFFGGLWCYKLKIIQSLGIPP